MPLPDYQTLMRPLLALAENGEVNVSECINKLSDQFGLSDEERQEKLPSRNETKIYNRVHWARTYLDKAGAIEKTRRSHFKITSRGLEMLDKNPDRIDNKLLYQFPEFIEFKTPKEKKKTTSSQQTDGAEETALEDATPEDRIEAAYNEINNNLESELRERLFKTDPLFFERVVLDLLVAMGYGGSSVDAAKTTKKTSDGGIDGIIKEDALGLDVIYLQAKRYAVDNSVGREAVQAFVGALAGHNATKGIFITTSRFSKPAVEYAQGQKVILIDGDELARLMVHYGVGARTEWIIEFKKVDLSYFDEGEG